MVVQLGQVVVVVEKLSKKYPPAQWSIIDDSIQVKVKFTNFKTLMHCVNAIADLAELCKHHPILLCNYRLLHITLQTHDAHNTVTQKDYDLAWDIQLTLSEYDIEFL
jgi:4a-hydroxytetrahydrobiopterin dehydratase